jgi:hypothetical protein
MQRYTKIKQRFNSPRHSYLLLALNQESAKQIFPHFQIPLLTSHSNALALFEKNRHAIKAQRAQ